MSHSSSKWVRNQKPPKGKIGAYNNNGTHPVAAAVCERIYAHIAIFYIFIDATHNTKCIVIKQLIYIDLKIHLSRLATQIVVLAVIL